MAKHRVALKKCRTGIRWWWRRAHLRSRTGVVITLVYLMIIFLTVWHKSDAFLKLELNALGDFLAGTFAPLALLWLVIGYFQQGEELRQNSRALLLQAEELHQAAEHAGGLLDVARKEHELAMEQLREAQRQREIAAERQKEARERLRKEALQPSLSFHLAFIHNTNSVRVQLTNTGHSCADFSLDIPENSLLKLVKPVEEKTLGTHGNIFFVVKVLNNLGTTPVIAHWTDDDGTRSKSEFISSVARDQLTIVSP
jgi:hypothetical protein